MNVVVRNTIIFTLFSWLNLTCLGVEIAHHVVQWHTQQLEQEDAALKKSVKKALGITEQQWDQALSASRKAYGKDDQEFIQKYACNGPLKPELMAVAQNLLREKSIRPSSVTIVNNNPNSPISHKSCIGICQDFFATFTQEETEAVIMHEIIHIIHEDSVVWEAMLRLMEQASWYKKPFALAAMQKWRLFRERRADILAGLSARSRAKALATFFQKLLKDPNCCNPLINLHHPSYKERIAYMLSLADEITSGQIKQSTGHQGGISAPLVTLT